MFRWDDFEITDYECDPVFLDPQKANRIQWALSALKTRTCEQEMTRITEVSWEAEITGYDGEPRSDVQVRCKGEDEIRATSDEDGWLGFTIELLGSIPCGTVGCEELVFSHPTTSDIVEVGFLESYRRSIALDVAP
jgi:hypothetical protein